MVPFVTKRTMHHRLTSKAAIAAATVALVALGATPASAAETPWYFSALKLDAGAAEGFTGDGVTIAVIDGQINPEVPALVGANLDIHEPSFCYGDDGEPVPATSTELSLTKPTDHGTNVVSMIAGTGSGYDGQSGITGVAPGAKILYYSVYTSSSEEGALECLDDGGVPVTQLGEAMDAAIDDGADIISVSLSMGANGAFVDAAARAFREGVVVLGSLSNSSELELTGGMPGFANGAIGVQAAAADGQVQGTDGVPNRNFLTDIVAPGLGFTLQGDRATGQWSDQFEADGTSLATPLAAGVIALAMEKYPDATGNQIIQSVIHNTSGDPDHDPALDPDELIGYGLISVTNLMATDPAKYDDVNPLIQEVAGSNDALIPTYDEIFAAEPEADAPAPDPSDDAPAQQGLPGWIWVLLAGLAVVVVVVIIVVVLVVRKRPSSSPSNSH